MKETELVIGEVGRHAILRNEDAHIVWSCGLLGDACIHASMYSSIHLLNY